MVEYLFSNLVNGAEHIFYKIPGKLLYHQVIFKSNSDQSEPHYSFTLGGSIVVHKPIQSKPFSLHKHTYITIVTHTCHLSVRGSWPWSTTPPHPRGLVNITWLGFFVPRTSLWLWVARLLPNYHQVTAAPIYVLHIYLSVYVNSIIFLIKIWI